MPKNQSSKQISGYIDAAKSTWQLIKARGLDAVVNDMIIDRVLSTGGLIVAFVCFGSVYLFGISSIRDLPTDTFSVQGLSALYGLVALLLGASIFGVMSTTITSGVATLFVCAAEDPATLARNQPLLFTKMQEVYPAVNWGARSSVAV